jgi:hypothetical protein
MPNPRFVLTRIPDLNTTVPVEAKLNIAKNLNGKYIYVQVDNSNNHSTYHHIIPSRR